MNEINNILFEYSDYIFSILGFFLWVAVVVLFKQKGKIKELLQVMDRSRIDNRELLDVANEFMLDSAIDMIERKLIYKHDGVVRDA